MSVDGDYLCLGSYSFSHGVHDASYQNVSYEPSGVRYNLKTNQMSIISHYWENEYEEVSSVIGSKKEFKIIGEKTEVLPVDYVPGEVQNISKALRKLIAPFKEEHRTGSPQLSAVIIEESSEISLIPESKEEETYPEEAMDDPEEEASDYLYLRL